MGKFTKRMICLVCTALLALAVFCGVNNHSLRADAASDIIVVTNALSGATLYSGNDLQEAFDAAERGSIVYIGRTINVTSPITIKVECMISGFSFIRMSGDGKFLLTEDGALYVDERISTRRIGALHDYSSVDYTMENGAYVYFLVTQNPSMDDIPPVITIAGDLLGAKVNDGNVICVDIAVDGLSVYDFCKQVSIKASNAEDVTNSMQNSVQFNGTDCVPNGSSLVAKAYNYDTKTAATKTYTIVVLGDVNGNGRIDSSDAYLIASYVAGNTELSDMALWAADADQDGVVTAEDADIICKKYVRTGLYNSPLQE